MASTPGLSAIDGLSPTGISDSILGLVKFRAGRFAVADRKKNAPYITVIPSDAPVGAEIRGVDLSLDVDDATFTDIEAAWAEHGVIFFRDQDITPEQQLAFGRRFGGVEKHNRQAFTLPDHPEITIVSNVKEDREFIGLADAGRTWHSDMSWSARPPRGSLLYAKEVPIRDGEVLGDTLFASAGAAYDALPEAIKQRVHGLKAIHQLNARKRIIDERSRPEPSKQQPNVVHPVIRTHPVTGRKCIYVNAGECIGVEGMADDDALPLIDTLTEQVIRPEFIYRHKWRVGDLVIWDNCAVQHLAINDYDLSERRLMHRVTVNGSIPF